MYGMANIYPPQYDTPLGQLRALLFQTQQYPDPANPEAPADYLISDDQLSAYIAINGDKLYSAAVDALLAIATNESLISKKIRTEDLSTDGPAVAAELRRTAETYRLKQKELDEAEDSLEAFEIVDFTEYPSKWPLR
jgi:hypothetical protein